MWTARSGVCPYSIAASIIASTNHMAAGATRSSAVSTSTIHSLLDSSSYSSVATATNLSRGSPGSSGRGSALACSSITSSSSSSLSRTW